MFGSFKNKKKRNYRKIKDNCVYRNIDDGERT